MLESINGAPFPQRSIARDPTTGAITTRTPGVTSGSTREFANANFFKVLKKAF